MKNKIKLSTRDKWLVAFLPTLIIVPLYAFVISGSMDAELKKQQGRVAANSSAASGSSVSALAKAKAELEKATQNVKDRQKQLEDNEAQLATLKSTASEPEDREPCTVIERIDAIFARNGITPLVSESVGDRNNGSQDSPMQLLNVLSPKNKPGTRGSRVWHYVFADVTPRLRLALEDLTRDMPKSVVPLSLNFVLNPEDDGQTHLLELWLLY